MNKELMEKLGLPEVSQIGVVVKDVEKTIAYYESFLNIGPFVRVDHIFDEVYYYGKLVKATWKFGFVSLGSVELELIQPLNGPTVYHDFLKEHGEGIQHLGFDVKDFDKKIEVCEQLGIEIIQQGKCKVARFAYFDTNKIGGITLEIIERKARRV